jgi:mRNA-degrading endonuclease toxin of MazEF toxin-antitoxin module
MNLHNSITFFILLLNEDHNINSRKSAVANVSQIITFDKDSLTEAIGVLDKLTNHQVDEGIGLVLSI